MQNSKCKTKTNKSKVKAVMIQVPFSINLKPKDGCHTITLLCRTASIHVPSYSTNTCNNLNLLQHLRISWFSEEKTISESQLLKFGGSTGEVLNSAYVRFSAILQCRSKLDSHNNANCRLSFSFDIMKNQWMLIAEEVLLVTGIFMDFEKRKKLFLVNYIVKH